MPTEFIERQNIMLNEALVMTFNDPDIKATMKPAPKGKIIRNCQWVEVFEPINANPNEM
jgi:hypothetical protein